MPSALVELRVVDVEENPQRERSIFVRCVRSSRGAEEEEDDNDILVVEDDRKQEYLTLVLVDGVGMWETHVDETQKPSMLDCEPREYLRVVEQAFTRGNTNGRQSFTFKWSNQKSTLTLMEVTQSIAMKYTSLVFSKKQESNMEDAWMQLLHDIVVSEASMLQQLERKQQQVTQVTQLVATKDGMLESALNAKQTMEDQLFGNFCAVLNAKKQEIARLQQQVLGLQMQMQSGACGLQRKAGKKSAARKPPITKMSRGARLTRQTIKEEEDDVDRVEQEDSGADEDSDKEDDDAEDESPKRERIKNEAIEAYNHIPQVIRRSSQICSADDVLNDLDALVRDEVEANEQAEMSSETPEQSPRPTRKRLRTSHEASRTRRTAVKSFPVENSPTEKKSIRAKEPSPPPSPPAKNATNSEEEDILDMLA